MSQYIIQTIDGHKHLKAISRTVAAMRALRYQDIHAESVQSGSIVSAVQITSETAFSDSELEATYNDVSRAVEAFFSRGLSIVDVQRGILRLKHDSMEDAKQNVMSDFMTIMPFANLILGNYPSLFSGMRIQIV